MMAEGCFMLKVLFCIHPFLTLGLGLFFSSVILSPVFVILFLVILDYFGLGLNTKLAWLGRMEEVLCRHRLWFWESSCYWCQFWFGTKHPHSHISELANERVLFFLFGL
jgi:hypothetical protein